MRRTLGIVLCVLGLMGVVLGIGGYTTRQDLVILGPIHATTQVTHHQPWLAALGALAIFGGVVILLTAKDS